MSHQEVEGRPPVIAAMVRWKCRLQVRGSIPLYWNQEGVTHLKPDITLQHYDPLYTATRLHFEVDHPHLILLVCGHARSTGVFACVLTLVLQREAMPWTGFQLQPWLPILHQRLTISSRAEPGGAHG